MITEIGKFLRVLRAMEEESARDMAAKLGVSPSYLSAVELGKRSVPVVWEDLFLKNYVLTDISKAKLHEIMAKSQIDLKRLDISEVDSKKRDLILSMANNDLDDETLEKLSEIITKNNKRSDK